MFLQHPRHRKREYYIANSIGPDYENPEFLFVQRVRICVKFALNIHRGGVSCKGELAGIWYSSTEPIRTSSRSAICEVISSPKSLGERATPCYSRCYFPSCRRPASAGKGGEKRGGLLSGIQRRRFVAIHLLFELKTLDSRLKRAGMTNFEERPKHCLHPKALSSPPPDSSFHCEAVRGAQGTRLHPPLFRLRLSGLSGFLQSRVLFVSVSA